MIRDWRDPRWTSVKAIAGGLDTDTRAQRKILFGDNLVDIEGKGIFTLMVDEVRVAFCLTAFSEANTHVR